LFNFSIEKNGPIKTALKHKSYSKKNNNERLEFLGDVILSSIVSETLYYRNKNDDEGKLSKKRESIVSRKNLNQKAKSVFKEGWLKHKTKNITNNMYGDFLEALIGGIYLEKGYEKTKEFVLKNIIDKTTKKIPKQEDFKGKLIYLLNKENKKVNFVKTDHRGPDHDRLHKVELMIDGESQMTEWAPSFKEAERKLSKAVFLKLYEKSTHN